jgi:site-specific DNA recombinase
MSKSKKYDGSGYHLYYMCQAYHSKGKAACNTNLIPKEHIEKQVIWFIKSLLHAESIIDEVLEKLESDIERETKDIQRSLKMLEKELLNNENRQKKLDDDYFNGSMAVHQYNRLSEQIRMRNEELSSQINKFQRMIEAGYAKIKFDRNTVKQALMNFDSLFDSATNEQKKALIRALIKRIDVEPDRKSIKEITFWFFDKPILPLSNTRRAVSYIKNLPISSGTWLRRKNSEMDSPRRSVSPSVRSRIANLFACRSYFPALKNERSSNQNLLSPGCRRSWASSWAQTKRCQGSSN